MKPIDLNEFPRWSVWPARLLKQLPWSVPERTIEKIDIEYDKNKYKKLLEDYIATDSKKTPDEVIDYAFSSAAEQKLCILRRGSLYEVSLRDAQTEYYELLAEVLSEHLRKCNSVVELGAGCGYNLWFLRKRFPDKNYMGGEYSQNAVKLSSLIYKNESNIAVKYFNFYEKETYRILESLKPPVLVFTCHAVEQLPSAAMVPDMLADYREQIEDVLHFEPAYELHNNTLLGLMQRRYAEVNDYNRDLISQLKSRSFVQIIKTDTDVFGFNPMNPTSIIHWKFKS
ncbi:MAG: hypothetical protein ABIH42_04990 [Planctomycetota bacterium]